MDMEKKIDLFFSFKFAYVVWDLRKDTKQS
jgi:hypothetical protein